MRNGWLSMVLVTLIACGGGDDGESAASFDASTADTTTDDSGSADAARDTDIGPACDGQDPDQSLGDVTWLTLDGASEERFTFADLPFDTQDNGGVPFDLHREAVFGANGFRADGPMRVVGAQVRFDNLSAEVAPVPVTAWPDFGANGFDFRWDTPLQTAAVCLSASDNDRWATVRFDPPIELRQFERVFVGYAREALAEGERHGPELMMENVQAEEPYIAGARWPAWDADGMYGGTSSPWYTWQVRLAVEPTPRVADDATWFEKTEGFRAGSRVAFGDFDNDGDDDLMTNGPTLYENRDGTFVDITGAAIPNGVTGANGGVWADYDDDGCLDFFATGGRDRLLRSTCDGRFEDATAASGIDDTQAEVDCNGDGLPEPAPTEAAAWFDADGDGDLDLYLANYECTSEFASYVNYRDRLFLNERGVFTDASEQLIDARDAGRGVTPVDLDLDGDTDLFVSNYRLDANYVYEQRGGELVEVARQTGLQGSEVRGAFGHTIGTAFGDLDGDGDLDVVMGNLAHPRFYDFSDRSFVGLNDGFGVFEDRSAASGFRYQETYSSPVLFDADLDGHLDLLLTAVYVGRDADFYVGNGDGTFALANHEAGIALDNGWGAAAADTDLDGDLDLVAYDHFENRGEPDAHWVQVRAVGVGRNLSAIGAIVEVHAGDQTWVRFVGGGEGTGCQSSFTQTVGLGERSAIDRIVVRFPTGEAVTIDAPDVDARHWVYADGTTTQGFAPRR